MLFATIVGSLLSIFGYQYDSMHTIKTTVMMGSRPELTGHDVFTGRIITIKPTDIVKKQITTAGFAGCTALGLYVLHKNKNQHAILMHQPFIEHLHVEVANLLHRNADPNSIQKICAIIFSPYEIYVDSATEKWVASYTWHKKIYELKKKIAASHLPVQYYEYGYDPEPKNLTGMAGMMWDNDNRKSVTINLHPDATKSNFSIEGCINDDNQGMFNP